ncbi:MAG: hypothetical protein Ta2C_07230 [Candidatus Endomicrobiellum trichonymphae]|nr:MAG: hypothetical protein Ta2C_07230 [Candidatus Endomicrobium trichonymphae]
MRVNVPLKENGLYMRFKRRGIARKEFLAFIFTMSNVPVKLNMAALDIVVKEIIHLSVFL